MGRGGCEGEVLHHRYQKSEKASPYFERKEVNQYRLSDVALHNKQDDCWLIVKNKVYDVSKFAETHPGGRVIYTHAGKDATDSFAVFHGSATWTLLQTFQIGEYLAEEPTPALVQDFRNLRATFQRQGLFCSSKLYYLYKCCTTLGLLVLAWGLVARSSSWPTVLLSATLLGLFQQQAGWLSHDFLHHQVFKWRPLNTFIGGYLLGNVVQGFSCTWWTRKHNTHHAAPNECDEAYNAIDPDIDTIPILAWSREMLATIKSPAVRSFLRWQAQLFFPILMFARFAWLNASWQYVRGTKELSSRKRLLETVLLLLHFAWTLGIRFGHLPASRALLHALLSEFVSGIFLGLVFVQSHNGMEIYAGTKDFYSAQIVSTRDIQSGLFMDWFSGGLNRQLEHHLFPTIPRHNLKHVTKPVKALCQKHGLLFEDVNMIRGTRLVLRRLAEVAAAA